MNLDDAKALLEQGRLAEAQAAYQQLSGDPRLRAQCFYGLGLISLKKQDLSSAHSWLSKTVDEDPRHLNARFYLGEMAASRGDKGLATRLYAEVLALNPQHVGALKRITSVNAPVAVAGSHPAASSPPPAIGIGRAPTRPVPSEPPPQPVAPPSSQSLQAVGSLGAPPSPPSSKRSLVGRARLVKLQAVAFNGTPAAKQSLTFRLDVADNNGNLARSLGIEMRGFHVRGSIENGDWVEVYDISKTGKVKSCRNLSTGQQVKHTCSENSCSGLCSGTSWPPATIRRKFSAGVGGRPAQGWMGPN